MLLSTTVLLISALSANAQGIPTKTQDFSAGAATPTTYVGTPGTPTNAATAGYFNPDFTQTGPSTGAFGAADNNASTTPNTIAFNFAPQTFQRGSTGNRITFQLGQKGSFGFDNNNVVRVSVSLNGGAPVTALTILGPNSNGAPQFAIGTGAAASGSYDAPATVTQGTTATTQNPDAGSVANFTVNLPNFTVRTPVGVTITITAARKSTVLIDNVVVSSSSPLPVALTRFDAAAKGTGVALRWATASEKNSAYFEVQRSTSGEDYETLGKVAAQGSSSSLREYDFDDTRPLAGLAYYRLRQVDVDGSAAYSPVATAHHNPETAIYPNPITDAVTLPAGLGPVRYRVLNGLGQALSSGQATGGDRLDLRALPKGTFFLELTDTAGRRTQRLMRQ